MDVVDAVGVAGADGGVPDLALVVVALEYVGAEFAPGAGAGDLAGLAAWRSGPCVGCAVGAAVAVGDEVGAVSFVAGAEAWGCGHGWPYVRGVAAAGAGLTGPMADRSLW